MYFQSSWPGSGQGSRGLLGLHDEEPPPVLHLPHPHHPQLLPDPLLGHLPAPAAALQQVMKVRKVEFKLTFPWVLEVEGGLKTTEGVGLKWQSKTGCI